MPVFNSLILNKSIENYLFYIFLLRIVIKLIQFNIIISYITLVNRELWHHLILLLFLNLVSLPKIFLQYYFS